MKVSYDQQAYLKILLLQRLQISWLSLIQAKGRERVSQRKRHLMSTSRSMLGSRRFPLQVLVSNLEHEVAVKLCYCALLRLLHME